MNPLGLLLGILAAVAGVLGWWAVAGAWRRRGRRVPGPVSAVAVAACLVAGYAVAAAYYAFYSLDWLQAQQTAGRPGLAPAVESSVADVRRLAWSLVLLGVLACVVAYQLGRARRPAEAVTAVDGGEHGR